jgi:hypothetical protein
VLGFEINTLTRVGMTVRIVHNVRIDMLRPSDVATPVSRYVPSPTSVSEPFEAAYKLILVSRSHPDAHLSVTIAEA